MPIPLNYNLRNLFVRRTTTVMTMSGIALTVAVFLAALALVNGLRATLESTGSPLNLLVLRKGSTTELNSAIREDVYRDMLFNAGIAHLSNSESPAASLELVTVVNLPRPGSLGGESTALRGVLPVGIELRNLRLQDGRWFQPGQREIVVGASVALRCADARVGKRLRIGNSEWQVVGIMDGGHSAVNSEIFADLNQVSTDFNRREQYSSVLVRAASASTISALANSFDNDPRLNVKTQSEQDYYARQTASGTPMLQLGLLVAFIMAIGSSFAAMNTMYATIARRAREIGTLRVLGFSQASIMLSFLAESAILAGFGGLIGCLLVLPLNAVTTSVGNFTTMSQTGFTFHVGLRVALTGIGFSLAMGLVGGFFPARSAAKKEILRALRGA